MEREEAFLGQGMKFPPQVDPLTGQFKKVKGREDIKEAIYIILMTTRGERMMKSDFGSNIQGYVFDLSEETYVSLLKKEIIDSLAKWEPRIDQIEAAIDTAQVHLGKLHIEVSYRVRATNSKDNLVFPYYIQ